MHESHQKQAQETVQQTEQEFRTSAAKKREEARSYGELMKARKALQSLDEGAGLPRTEFWIPEPKKKLLTDDYSLSSIKSQVLESRGEYYKELATDTEVEAGIDAIEEPESAFEQLETFEKLVQVTNHLRATYFYCLWCGDKYSNKDELESLCPGPTRDDHDLD
ncbi:hypothetical protein HDU99_005951 [Rhizoclosmatium hyalinum]|nr:hypothetical protein HDU99_005951 [Rhizoclosmatium hyalinum]